MVDELASISDIGDLSKARLVAQTDVKNGVGKLVNYTYDEELDISIPAVMVEPASGQELDQGIRHSFRVTEDLFATGARTLVNHKKYYFIAIAYAYNQYKEYDPNDPNLLDGQKLPYLRSRISGLGGSIESVVGIPHDPTQEAGGTVFTTSYGFQPEITQLEGIGNGGTFLKFTQATVDEIFANNGMRQPVYASGAGPVGVKVIDPLNLKAGEYRLGFGKDSSTIANDTWWLERFADGVRDTVFSKNTIGTINEQLIIEWGLSVDVRQQYYEGFGTSTYTEPIDATIEFADSSKQWLAFVEDDDRFYPTNWIRSGNGNELVNHLADGGASPNPGCVADNWIYQPCHYDDFSIDTDQNYEKLLDGGIAPFRLVGKGPYGNPFGFPGENTSTPWYESNQSFFTTAGTAQTQASFAELHDVDIIITSDKTKWTRCPVIEMNDNIGQTEHKDWILEPRGDASVDKNGLSAAEGGNPAEANDVNETGMGWFPGYAIDINTGDRLNMAFSENSWLLGENGDDMIWNPTSSFTEKFGDEDGNPLLGGMHYVYVFGKDVAGSGSPAYDKGEWLRNMFDLGDTFHEPGDDTAPEKSTWNTNYRNAWKSCFWVMEPLLAENQELLATDVKISTRIKKPYEERVVDNQNEGFPLYGFTIDAPLRKGDGERLISVIDNINVVPNPYYAYSEYETGKLDNRIKITNLPEQCEITIFNMQGALVRQFSKDDPLTSLDWDLLNYRSVPIAGGVYLIHVKMMIDITDEEGNVIGTEEHEKILKWFGVMRKPDLDNL
jgi:hypothetical protein